MLNGEQQMRSKNHAKSNSKIEALTQEMNLLFDSAEHLTLFHSL